MAVGTPYGAVYAFVSMHFEEEQRSSEQIYLEGHRLTSETVREQYRGQKPVYYIFAEPFRCKIRDSTVVFLDDLLIGPPVIEASDNIHLSW